MIATAVRQFYGCNSAASSCSERCLLGVECIGSLVSASQVLVVWIAHIHRSHDPSVPPSGEARPNVPQTARLAAHVVSLEAVSLHVPLVWLKKARWLPNGILGRWTNAKNRLCPGAAHADWMRAEDVRWYPPHSRYDHLQSARDV